MNSKEFENIDYTILLPPPNITGSLHIGHFFNWSIQDCLLRYKKHNNYNINWKLGLDHAGISAQFVVERELKKENKTKEHLGKEQFIEKIWEWKKESENLIKEQASEFELLMNWEDSVFTLNEDYQTLVKKSFIKLFKDGLIYKEKKITNWDIKFQTAISDLEVIEKEEDKILYIIEYKNANVNAPSIKIATTRPETIFADSAIAVNTKDEKYINLKNNFFIIPLTNIKIPIIYDDYVKQDFGTGALKVTPSLDLNDYELGQTYNLEIKEIISKEGKIINTNSVLDNLNIEEARKKIIELLKKENYLIEEQKIKSINKYGEKSQEKIETILTDQWFINMKPLAKKALEESSKIEFFPEHLRNNFEQWLTNIEPWCISRQIWWGHQIPIYYTKNNKIIAALTKEEAQQIANEEVTQETSVLDTWFSSALWPIYNNSKKISEVLVTGKDILFFWVARMIMFSLYFENIIPFKKLLFHGIVRDINGKKMSKTLGNVINPIEINQIYGKDALRFTLLSKSNAEKEKDIKIKEEEIILNRNFLTKIENINNFINNFLDTNFKENIELDNWINNKIIKCANKINNYLNEFNFQAACEELYYLIYNDFAGIYIEGMKIFPSKKIYNFFNIILKIANPLIPHLTEDLFSKLNNKENIYNYKIELKEEKTNFENSIKIINLLRNLKKLTNIQSFYINENQELIAHLSKLKINSDQTIKIKIFNFEFYLMNQVINDFVLILNNKLDKILEEINKISHLLSTFNSKTSLNIINETKTNLENKIKEKKEIEELLLIFQKK